MWEGAGVTTTTPLPVPSGAAAAVVRGRLRLDRPLDLAGTVGGLRRGPGDPATRVSAGELWWATRSPIGPATLHLTLDAAAGEVAVEAWGEGAAWVVDQVPDLIGEGDDHRAFEALLAGLDVPGAELVRQAHRRNPGLRRSRSGAVFEALVPTILEQKVVGADARASYRGLVQRHGTPAPGPVGSDLLLPPSGTELAALPYWCFHPLGVERRRADTIRRVAQVRHRLVAGAPRDDSELCRRLLTLPGVGPWTVAEVSRVALGDADAVSVGDYHLPHQIAYAFIGEARSDDETMLELLEPFRPHRGRAALLALRAGPARPRRGPRLSRSRVRSL